MNGRRGLAGAVGVMFSGTFVSRGLGYVRASLLTVAVGAAGGAAGAFAVANTLPNTIYMLLAGGVINAVFVPQLVRAAKQADGGQEYANRLLTVAGAALLAVTVVLTASSVLLVQLYASQMSEEWLPVAYSFAFWCVPQIFFYGMYTLLGQVLNSREVFGPYMWAPVLNNIIAIGGIGFYIYQFGAMPAVGPDADQFGQDRIILLGATATAGVALQALILIIPLWRSGFRYRPRWGLQGLGAAGQMGGWTFAALIVGQLGFIVVSNVAAAAGAYGTSAEPIANNATYQLAFTVFMLPQSLIVVSVVTAMFTRLSQRASSRNGAGVRDDLSLSMRTVSVFTVLSAVAIVILATPIARVITVGQQPEQVVQDLSLVITALAIGIPGLALWSVVQRVYYAYQDAKSLFWIQVAMAGVVAGGSVIGTFILDPAGWVMGAGIAISVSYYVGALVGYVGLRRRLLSLDGGRVLRTHIRLFLAAVPTALVGYFIVDGDRWPSVVGAIAQMALAGIAMTVVYLISAHLLGVEEIVPFTRRLAPLFGRAAARVGLQRRSMAGESSAGGLSSQQRGDAGVLDDDLTSGMLLAGRYRVDELQPSPLPGVRAWAGRDTVLERPVEVLSVSGRHAESVLDGARRAGLIEDAHLPKVLRVGEHDSTGYVVLEPFPATTVAELLAYGEVSEDVARSIAGETAKAVEAARRRGVHHLGLSPELVGLTKEGGIQVLGMGIAGPALGLSPSADDAASLDAQAVVELLRTMVGEDSPLLSELGSQLRGAANVEVILAPWSAVPPSAQLREAAGAPPLLEPQPYDPDATSVLQAQVGDLDDHTLRVVSNWHPDVANISAPPQFESVLSGTRGKDGHAEGSGEPEGSGTDAAVPEDVTGSPRPSEAEEPAVPSKAEESVVASSAEAELSESTTAMAIQVPREQARPHAEVTPSVDTDPDGEPLTPVAGLAFGGRVRSWMRTLDRLIPAEDPQRRGVAPVANAASAMESEPDPVPDSGMSVGLAQGAGSAPWVTKSSDVQPAPGAQSADATVTNVPAPAPKTRPAALSAPDPAAPSAPDPADWRVRAPESFPEPPTFVGAVTQEQEVPDEVAGPDAAMRGRHLTDPEEQVTALSAWVAGQRDSFAAWRRGRAQAREARQELRATENAAAAAATSATATAPAQAASPRDTAPAATPPAAIPPTATPPTAASPAAAPAPAAPPAAASASMWAAAAAPAPVAPRPEAEEPFDIERAYPPEELVAAPEIDRDPPQVAAANRASGGYPEQLEAPPALSLQDSFDQTVSDAEHYQVPAGPTRTWGSMNATPYVLLLVLIGVVWVFWLAVGSLVSTARNAPQEEPDPTGNLIPDPAQTTPEPASTEESTAWAPLPDPGSDALAGSTLAESALAVGPADWSTIAG